MQKDNRGLFRRLAAAAVGAAVLMSLAACSKAPAEPTLPPHLIVDDPTSAHTTQPTEPPVTQSDPTLPPETTAPRIEIDYKNLVTDAFTDALIDEYNYEYCYHIPQFNLNGESAQQVNDRIFEQFYNILQWDVYPSMEKYDYTEIIQIAYNWGYHNNYASVVIQRTSDWSASFYDVFTVSLDTGREVSAEELLAEFGVDREAFYDLVHDRLEQYWDERNSFSYPEGGDFFEDRVKRTLADANVRTAIPYVNPNGGLSFVVNIYSLAGADSYYHLINAEGKIESDYPQCTQTHTYRSSVSKDDPLEYFVENCDRMYFTKADIQNFDEKMCLYARNAIYAKSGWIFSSTDLRNYFNSFGWYQPSVTSDEFTEDMLNSYQIANRDLIVNHENALKGANQDELQYFIENCDRRYFSKSEISGLDAEELVYARNAVYAKSGRIFNTEKFANYFRKYSWYTPAIPADEFKEEMLNQYQTANRDLIVAREAELNGITPDEAYEIACRYWDFEEGDIADETGFELFLGAEGTVEQNGTTYYAFRLRWLVTGEDGSSWMSTVDQVYVNAKTGECTYDIYS